MIPHTAGHAPVIGCYQSLSPGYWDSGSEGCAETGGRMVSQESQRELDAINGTSLKWRPTKASQITRKPTVFFLTIR